MRHPFETLRPEYAQLLAAMRVLPDRRKEVDAVAVKLLGYRTRYQPVSARDGVPVVFIAACFEREAGSDFSRNAAQGWPLHSRSRIVPENGPFPDWQSSALAAYHLNGLDRVGAENWTWELMCFYGELFNGFGYRDYHRMHSPYLWGGTNVQTAGKYTSDGKFDPGEMDQQLGIVPVMRRMVEIEPTLALPPVPYVAAPPVSSGIAAVSEVAEVSPNVTKPVAYDAAWVQRSLNQLGFWPELVVDGSYGSRTKFAVERFQADYGISVDGLVGTETTTAIRKAISTLESASKSG